MKVVKRSLITGKIHEMDLPITEDDLLAWESSGELIQRAFPHLSPDQREFLLSGATPEEWDAEFGEDDE